MKGVIFLALSEMIQKMYGHKAWNDILNESEVESKGIYTSTEVYSDKEAELLLSLIAKKLNKDQGDVLGIFGLYLIRYFNYKYPKAFAHKSFEDFICSINNDVHFKIEKISPSLSPPSIKVVEMSEGMLIVHYYSKRKLCSLAQGLIRGAGKIYNEKVEVKHLLCMHDGYDHCVFEVRHEREKQ